MHENEAFQSCRKHFIPMAASGLAQGTALLLHCQ